MVQDLGTQGICLPLSCKQHKLHAHWEGRAGGYWPSSLELIGQGLVIGVSCNKRLLEAPFLEKLGTLRLQVRLGTDDHISYLPSR